MKALAIPRHTAHHGMTEAFRQLTLLLVLSAAFFAGKSYADTTAACTDCGIYESLCKGKAVHWYIVDGDGWYIQGDPQNLLRSQQARSFIKDVKKKHPGKFHSKEICGNNPLA
ncbi:hypothetical protein ACFL0R_01610 [Pseudomonadota bacterium]